MAQGPRTYAHRIEVDLNIGPQYAYYPAYLVGGNPSFVDKSIEGPQRDPYGPGRFFCPHPLSIRHPDPLPLLSLIDPDHISYPFSGIQLLAAQEITCLGI